MQTWRWAVVLVLGLTASAPLANYNLAAASEPAPRMSVSPYQAEVQVDRETSTIPLLVDKDDIDRIREQIAELRQNQISKEVFYTIWSVIGAVVLLFVALGGWLFKKNMDLAVEIAKMSGRSDLTGICNRLDLMNGKFDLLLQLRPDRPQSTS